MDASLLLLLLLSADVFDLLIQFVDFSVLLFDFRSVFFDASLRVEERLLDESGIGLLHVWETLDAEVLQDLFDLLLQVEHFGLEFCSLRAMDDTQCVVLERVRWCVSVPAKTFSSRWWWCLSTTTTTSKWNGIGTPKAQKGEDKSGEKRTHDGHEFRRLGGVLRASRH